jgi:hypothetical protein
VIASAVFWSSQRTSLAKSVNRASLVAPPSKAMTIGR